MMVSALVNDDDNGDATQRLLVGQNKKRTAIKTLTTNTSRSARALTMAHTHLQWVFRSMVPLDVLTTTHPSPAWGTPLKIKGPEEMLWKAILWEETFVNEQLP
jgi:hypothetical protein